MEEPRRAQGDFGAADDRAEIRQRNKNAGVADHIVVQEVARAGVEIIHVERPSANRNAQSDIVLDIALARQRNEAEPLRHRKIERRTGQAVERRRLVVIRVVAVQRPVQTRNADGRAEPRIGGVLIEQPAIVREPDAEVEREPRSGLVLIFQKERVRVGPMRLRLIQNVSAGIGREPEKSVVVLAPNFDAGSRVVPLLLRLQNGAAAEVVRAGIVIQNEGIVLRPADVMSAVVMVIRSERERDPIGEAVRPMEAD